MFYVAKLLKLYRLNPLTLITDEGLSLSPQTSLSCDTDTALSNMKQIAEDVKEDHQSLVSHVS